MYLCFNSSVAVVITPNVRRKKLRQHEPTARIFFFAVGSFFLAAGSIFLTVGSIFLTVGSYPL